MRKPSEYLAAAMANLRSNLMKDCSMTLRHGDVSATVTRVGTTRKESDELSESEVLQRMKVFASSSDFPDIEVGSAVELGDSFRVVVALSTDPTKTTLSVGLSAAFEKCPATLTGTRRENSATRTIAQGFNALVLENGYADNYSNATAPTYATAYLVAIRREDWGETTDPEPSDVLTIAPDGFAIELKVSTVSARHDGWYILKCRTKG